MKNAVSLFLLLIMQTLFSQSFTRKDSLQGGLRPERNCFDVTHYTIDLKIDIKNKFISGSNEIDFKVVDETQKIQIDLFENLEIDSITWNKQKLQFNRDNNAVFINFPNKLQTNNQEKIQFYYHGNPVNARRAPWDGGFVFRKDINGNDWVGVACQGFGASCWLPIKDSQSDEPDNGVLIKIAVPDGLTNVSNGRFVGKENLNNGYTRWDWEVKNPINTYDITVNIGDYVHFSDKLDDLDIDYYVLSYHRDKAEKHFADDVKPMLKCFQEKFGEYPFKEDGYKLVETSYLGMEHQSAIAYGNLFLKGYMGNDLSKTGVGKLWDFIIIHESGHEWFGNSITSRDIADMWIHEGFTQYSEIVYTECIWGYEKAMQYANGLKGNVSNDEPIIGPYGVNKEGSGDMYPKGALLLNTLRHVVNNDTLWWNIIHDYATTFKHKIIDTQAVIDFFNQKSGMNLTSIFNQYLRTTSIPKLELKIEKKKLFTKWVDVESNFSMPIDLVYDNKTIRVETGNGWKKTKIKIKNINDIKVLTNKFYINY
ncbi:M1 family metallopeptidase [Flavobacterium sp.]|uniref:M1 family metallopeptidase n=1 Tax=Flavobacterium sp. TaxID=239 RepID=UPI0035B09879